MSTQEPTARRGGPVAAVFGFVWGQARRVGEFHHGLRQQSVPVWITLSLIGFVLLGLAWWPVQNGEVTFHGRLLDGTSLQCLSNGVVRECQLPPKQVGYWFALNWSVMGTLVMPTIVALALRLYWEMEQSLRLIARSMMARTPDFAAISETHLIERWRVDRKASGVLPRVAGALGFIFVMGGWVAQVAVPIVDGHVPEAWLIINGPNEEFDWAIASLMDLGTQHVRPIPNFIFDLIAYLLVPGMLVSYAFAAMLDGALFVAFACGNLPSAPAKASDGADLPTDWRLAPDLRDEDDPRRGFGIFEGFFTALLGCAFFIMLGLFLVVTQNAYLRDPSSQSIGHFFFADWSAALTAATTLFKGGQDFWASIASLLVSEKAINLLNPKSLLSVFLFLLVVGISVGASWVLLRSAAIKSQHFARKHLAPLAESLAMAPEVAEKRLETMRAWPLAWISEAMVVAIIILSCASLVSFRLIMAPAALALIWALVRIVRLFLPKQPAADGH